MSEARADSFNLDDTYVFLKDGGSAPLVPSGGFWQELMSGQPKSSGVALVAGGDGWLLAKYSIERDAQAWELHPAGDELLTMLAGEMDVVFERAGGCVFAGWADVPRAPGYLAPSGCATFGRVHRHHLRKRNAAPSEVGLGECRWQAAEQGHEPDEALGGMVAREWTCRLMPTPVNFGRGHRFAAYPRCSTTCCACERRQE